MISQNEGQIDGIDLSGLETLFTLEVENDVGGVLGKSEYSKAQDEGQCDCIVRDYCEVRYKEDISRIDDKTVQKDDKLRYIECETVSNEYEESEVMEIWVEGIVARLIEQSLVDS